MNQSPLKILCTALCAVFLFNSCSNDDEQVVPSTTNDTTNTTALITEWNDLWLEVDRYTSGMRPTATARAMAYIHLAAYETAVAQMDSYRSTVDTYVNLNIDQDLREEDVDLDLALSTAYATAIEHFMYNVDPLVAGRTSELQVEKEVELSDGLSAESIAHSITWGTYVANRVIAFSQTDTASEEQIIDPQPFAYEPPVAPGYWTYSADEERAWFPYWSAVRTFVISPEETSSELPYMDYDESVGSTYYNEMNEVYTVSTAAGIEENEDLWIAHFWSDDVEGLMMSPPGRQLSIANQLIIQTDLDYDESLALLLKLGFSLNDAAVSSWADKYEYMVMRPSVYIQEHIDADFQTNLFPFIYWPNPSFPGYPSGHSTFATAAAGVFIDTFGNDTPFTDRSHEGRVEFLSEPRSYNTLSEMATENAFSRIPLGVHIRMDCVEGARLGYEISEAVNSYNLSN